MPYYLGTLKQAVMIEYVGSSIRCLARIKKTPWITFSLKELEIVDIPQLGGRTYSNLHHK